MKEYRDPVVEFYKRKVDMAVLRENLKLTHEQRLLKHQRALEMIKDLERAGKKITPKQIKKVTAAVYSVPAAKRPKSDGKSVAR
jgi:hypothetical protein